MGLPPKLAKRLDPYGELDQSQTVSPALTIEEFFEGNNDEGSIGCNLVPHPGLAAFRQTFVELRDSSDVADVRLPVVEWIDGLDWPFTDKVIVVTKSPTQQIAARVASLSPDDVSDLDSAAIPNFDGLFIPSGFRPVVIWWD